MRLLLLIGCEVEMRAFMRWIDVPHCDDAVLRAWMKMFAEQKKRFARSPGADPQDACAVAGCASETSCAFPRVSAIDEASGA
jgi:hypothetical protein